MHNKARPDDIDSLKASKNPVQHRVAAAITRGLMVDAPFCGAPI